MIFLFALGLVGILVGIVGLIKGNINMFNIPNRKVAGIVLVVSLVAFISASMTIGREEVDVAQHESAQDLTKLEEKIENLEDRVQELEKAEEELERLEGEVRQLKEKTKHLESDEERFYINSPAVVTGGSLLVMEDEASPYISLDSREDGAGLTVMIPDGESMVWLWGDADERGGTMFLTRPDGRDSAFLGVTDPGDPALLIMDVTGEEYRIYGGPD